MKKKKSYKTLILDIGGVMLHWNPKECIQKLQKEDPSFSDEIHTITKTSLWRDFDAGLILQTELLAQLEKQYPRLHLDRFFEISKQSLKPITLGLEFLDRAQKKGLETYFLSNMPAEFYDTIIKEYSFMNNVTGAVFSCHVKCVKPDRLIYLYLLHKFNIDPSTALFIDDYEPNIKAARELGIDAILCSDHKEVLKELHQRSII